MTDWTTVIGVDPGPIPGIAVLLYADNELVVAQALQCSANWIDQLLEHEISLARAAEHRIFLSVEKYLPRRAASRMTSGWANQRTQTMAIQIVERYTYLAKKLAEGWGTGKESASLRIASYPGSPALRWATEHRLRKTGLWDATVGCVHARSAACHALYCAVKDAHLPDPLAVATPPARLHPST